MKRQLTSILLFSALLVGGASTFVSCTDHESDSAYNTSVSLADAIKQKELDLDAINNWLGRNKADAPENLQKAIDARIADNWKAKDPNDILSALGKYASLDEAIEKSKAYQGLDSRLASIEKLRVKDSTAFAVADSTLKANTDTLIAHLDKKMEDAQLLQNKLNKTYDNMFDYLFNKKIDGIAINATENPVLGYWNAAFVGSQLNMVAAYYGVPANGNEDWGIKANKVITDNQNAGYIYITLNPTEVDPALVTEIKLVDSQGNEAPGFELGKPVETSKVLKYGYTRAASANGFYAVPVKCVDPENDGFSLNKGALKESAKNILAKLKNPSKTNLNLSQIGSTLYSTVNNKLVAYTVKVGYKYLSYDATKQEASVVTKHVVAPTYNVAAFAVKPLSYKFLANNSTIENISLDRFMLPTMSDKLSGINAIDFDNIIDPSTGKEIEVASIVAVPGVKLVQNGANVDIIQISNNKVINTIKNATVEYKGKADQGIDIDVEGDNYGTTLETKIYQVTFKDNTVKDLIDNINSSIAGKLEPVQNVINKINNAANSYDSNIVPAINNLLKRIESGIHNANKLLQPAMMYQDANDNWHFVSTDNHFATALVGRGATELVATSYTGEYLAPAYKKTLEVNGGATITLPNGKSAEKVSGDCHKFIFNASEPGKYTVVYKAVDYSGKEVVKNFYITVK